MYTRHERIVQGERGFSGSAFSPYMFTRRYRNAFVKAMPRFIKFAYEILGPLFDQELGEAY